MAGTFSQIYIQVVFAVRGRENLLLKSWRDEVFKYMAGIVKGKNQKPIIVNGVINHVHLFIGLRPSWHYPIWSEMSRIIQPISSTIINMFRGNFPGRKDLDRFLMLIAKSARFINTY